MKNFLVILLLTLVTLGSSGCLLAAAGLGAEAAYISTQEDRTMLETLDDQRITAAIKTKMIADDDVEALDINVDTFKNVVTLTGIVETPVQIRKAQNIARSVYGVTDVRSDLTVE